MILREEYDEARGALDEEPGLLTGAIVTGAAASALSGVVLANAAWAWALCPFFLWILTAGCVIRIFQHRRTIARWRDQERERLLLAEVEGQR